MLAETFQWISQLVEHFSISFPLIGWIPPVTG